jgi:hypothetical protein
MTTIRWFGVGVCAVLAFGLMAQPAGASTTSVERSSVEANLASFVSTRGCIESDVEFAANRSTEPAPPISDLVILVTRVNTCTHATLADSFGSTDNVGAFQIDSNDKFVHASGSIVVKDFITNTVATVDVDMTWNATGPEQVTRFPPVREPLTDGSGYVVVTGYEAVRPATATGTLRQGLTVLASGTATSAQITERVTTGRAVQTSTS